MHIRVHLQSAPGVAGMSIEELVFAREKDTNQKFINYVTKIHV